MQHRWKSSNVRESQLPHHSAVCCTAQCLLFLFIFILMFRLTEESTTQSDTD